MDSDQNTPPSSEDTVAETISNTVEMTELITNENTENDFRIKCTNSQSVRNIFDITLNQFEELANSCNLKDIHPNIVSVFSETFKNVLQENILVNGLPLMIDENKTLSSPERKERLSMVDDVLLGKLSKKISTVAQERKFIPEQCRRILNIEMKHEIQNLKKAKVTDSSLPSTSFVVPSNKDMNHIRNFSDFCQGFGTMQETVQCKVQEKEKLVDKLNLVKEIQNSSSKSSNN